jgi:hypothetical protein
MKHTSQTGDVLCITRGYLFYNSGAIGLLSILQFIPDRYKTRLLLGDFGRVLVVLLGLVRDHIAH